LAARRNKRTATDSYIGDQYLQQQVEISTSSSRWRSVPPAAGGDQYLQQQVEISTSSSRCCILISFSFLGLVRGRFPIPQKQL